MNPVVLIATHHRKEITSRNIELLFTQSRVPEIVLVCSEEDEYYYFQNKYPSVHVLQHKNNPLGEKWGFGARSSASLNPNPLIILGSDDLFGKYFIRNICAEIQKGYDFVGINRWWLHEEGKKETYLLQYTVSNFPLGGGRAYSKRILEKMRYRIFDEKKDRRLDDFGWIEAKKKGAKSIIISEVEKHGLNIVSIKGKWETMNSANTILKARSVQVIGKFDKSKLEELL